MLTATIPPVRQSVTSGTVTVKNCQMKTQKDYVGTHRCKCKRGFEDKGMGFNGDCVDINECKTGNNKCVGANVTCKNLPGGYKCPCKPGFAGDMRRGCKGKLALTFTTYHMVMTYGPYDMVSRDVFCSR